MRTDAELSEREKLILRAVVHSYITSAEPVGSRSIVKRFDMGLSPATVRNVMSDLEEYGYLQQLHTSSGRVPTDEGYRYYVDYLMRVQELTLQERARIEKELSAKLDDADEVMRQTSHLLALMADQTGIVEVPDDVTAQVNRIELVPISQTRIAVLIADSMGRVRTQIVSMEGSLEGDRVQRLSGFLNDNLRGVSLDNLAQSLHTRLRMYMDEQRALAEDALSILQLLPAHRPGQLFLDGVARLFEQPEFRDVERAREVFGFLEEREGLVELLRTGIARETQTGTYVVIGKEAIGKGIEGISIVASPYSVGSRPVGMIGVLGPRRMPYSRITAVVDYTAGMLSRLLTRLAGAGS